MASIRKLVMPTAFYGLDEKTQKVNENVVIEAFTAAGLQVNCEPIDLTREQAEQIIPLQRNNPMWEHEVADLAAKGRISCLITLSGSNVDQVVKAFLPLGLNKFEKREFISASPTLVRNYGNSLSARIIDAEKLT